MRQEDIFYEAMLTRDYRFDGKFFVGVRTTGVYCRPICPAKPLRKNVEFFANAHKAEKAGYRPCIRCRPEAAPLSAVWYGTSAIVKRALKVIATNQRVLLSEDDFAVQFGISARHLRRLFNEEIGKTPKQICDQNRLNFARKLAHETHLPMTVIAETAGFTSLRRFNDSFKKRFHKAPSQFRKGSDVNEPAYDLRLSLRPPYDWSAVLDFLRSHKIAPIESVLDGNFERIFCIENDVGWLQVSPRLESSELKLKVVVSDVCLILIRIHCW